MSNEPVTRDGTPDRPETDAGVVLDPDERRIVDAVRGERAALEVVLDRLRAVMLLHAAADTQRASRGVRDLELASAALATSSDLREAAVTPVFGSGVTGRALEASCSPALRSLIVSELERQRELAAEIGVISSSVEQLVERSTTALRRRRSALDAAANGKVTYQPM